MMLLLLAIGPPIALMTFFYLADRYEPEPRGHVLAVITLGAAIMLPAMGLVSVVAAPLGEFLLLGGFAARAFEAFVVEAFIEEGLEWLVLVLVVYRWREFDEPMDGLVYGVAVALGFGTVENILYVTEAGVRVGVLRALFAVPEHALFGAIMGSFVGRAKLGAGPSAPPPSRALKRRRIGLALAVPVLLHGTYNLVLLRLVGPAIYVGVGVGSAALWAATLGRLKQAHDDSPFRSP